MTHEPPAHVSRRLPVALGYTSAILWGLAIAWAIAASYIGVLITPLGWTVIAGTTTAAILSMMSPVMYWRAELREERAELLTEVRQHNAELTWLRNELTRRSAIEEAILGEMREENRTLRQAIEEQREHADKQHAENDQRHDKLADTLDRVVKNQAALSANQKVLSENQESLHTQMRQCLNYMSSLKSQQRRPPNRSKSKVKTRQQTEVNGHVVPPASDADDANVVRMPTPETVRMLEKFARKIVNAPPQPDS